MNNNINVVVGGTINTDYPKVYKSKFIKPGLPFESQVVEPDTKYVIKHNFDIYDGIVETKKFASTTSFNTSTCRTLEKITYDTWLSKNPNATEELKAAQYAKVILDCYYWIPIQMLAHHALHLTGRAVRLDETKTEKLAGEWSTIYAEEDITVYIGYIGNISSYTFRYDNCFTLPANSILEFDGGSINNGTLKGNNTVISASPVKIFDNIVIDGNWRVEKVYAEWFGVRDNIDCHSSVQNAIDFFRRWDLLAGKKYTISDTILIRADYIKIMGNASSTISYIADDGVLFEFNKRLDLLPYNYGPYSFEINNVFISFKCSSVTGGIKPNNTATCFKVTLSLIDTAFRNVRIYGAYRGFDFSKVQKGDSGSAWCIYYENVRISGSHIMYELNGYGAIQHLFDGCYFDAPTEGQIEGVDKDEPGICVKLTECDTVSFVNCNFGGEYSANQNKTMRFVEVWDYVTQVNFVTCNFETGFAPNWTSQYIDENGNPQSNNWRNALFCFRFGQNNIKFEGCYFLFYNYLNIKFQNAGSDYEATYDDYHNGRYSKLIAVGTGCALEIKNCKFDMRGDTSNANKIVYPEILEPEDRKRPKTPLVEYIFSDLSQTNIVLDNYSRQLIGGGYIPDNLGATSIIIKEGDNIFMITEKSCTKTSNENKTLPRKQLFFNKETNTLNYLKYGPYEATATTNYLGKWIRTNKLSDLRGNEQADRMIDLTAGDVYYNTSFSVPCYYTGTKWLDAQGFIPGIHRGSTVTRHVNVNFTEPDKEYGYQYYDFTLKLLCIMDRKDDSFYWLNSSNGFTALRNRGASMYRPVALHTINYYRDSNWNISTLQDETHNIFVASVQDGLNKERDIGFAYYDTTIHKMIYAKSISDEGVVTWVDALGNDVNTQYQTVAASNVLNSIDEEN